MPKTIEIRESRITHISTNSSESLEKTQQCIGINYIEILICKIKKSRQRTLFQDNKILLIFELTKNPDFPFPNSKDVLIFSNPEFLLPKRVSVIT